MCAGLSELYFNLVTAGRGQQRFTLTVYSVQWPKGQTMRLDGFRMPLLHALQTGEWKMELLGRQRTLTELVVHRFGSLLFSSLSRSQHSPFKGFTE